MTEYVVPSFGAHLVGVVEVLIHLAFLAALWALLDKSTSFDDERELFVRGNVPYAVLRVSLVLAQAVALLPLLTVTTGGYASDIARLLGWGAGVFIVLVLLHEVGRRVLRTPLGTSEGDDSLTTLSPALVSGGFYLAAGLVLNAALSGSAPNLGTAIAATLVFTLLGLVALVVGYVVLNLLPALRGSTTIAAAVLRAGVLVGLGLVLRTAIAGDFAGWASGIVGFLVTFAVGLVLLVLLILLLDLVVVRSRTLRQIVTENSVLAAVVMAAMVFAVALGIGALTYV